MFSGNRRASKIVSIIFLTFDTNTYSERKFKKYSDTDVINKHIQGSLYKY